MAFHCLLVNGERTEHGRSTSDEVERCFALANELWLQSILHIAPSDFSRLYLNDIFFNCVARLNLCTNVYVCVRFGCAAVCSIFVCTCLRVCECVLLFSEMLPEDDATEIVLIRNVTLVCSIFFCLSLALNVSLGVSTVRGNSKHKTNKQQLGLVWAASVGVPLLLHVIRLDFVRVCRWRRDRTKKHTIQMVRCSAHI